MLVRRELTAAMIASAILRTSIAHAQPSRATVKMQIDAATANAIPGNERSEVVLQQDNSASAEALKAEVPFGQATPVIYLVVGLLSIPVLWNTIHEMLQRDYYGGVSMDVSGIQISIRHDHAVPADMIFVTPREGNVKQFASADFSVAVLRDLIKSRFK